MEDGWLTEALTAFQTANLLIGLRIDETKPRVIEAMHALVAKRNLSAASEAVYFFDLTKEEARSFKPEVITAMHELVNEREIVGASSAISAFQLTRAEVASFGPEVIMVLNELVVKGRIEDAKRVAAAFDMEEGLSAIIKSTPRLRR